MAVQPPKRPRNALAKLLEIMEGKISYDLKKRLLSLQNIFDVNDWRDALSNLDPTYLNELLNSTSILQDGEQMPYVDVLTELLRQAAHEALLEWSKNKAQLYLPFGRPEAVEILNAPEFANLTQTVNLPDWARPLQSTKLNIKFDAADKAALDWAKRRAADLVTAIDEQTRQGIRQIIFDSVSQGIDADKTARRLRQVVGLHPRWARAVNTYEQKQYARLIREGLTPKNAEAKAAELAGKYRDTLVRKRAAMISRTEIMTVSNKGRELGWNSLAEAGLIDPVTEKEWLVAPSGSSLGAPCDNCAAMSRVRVRFNQAFPNGYFTPPAHPHCRCTVRLVPPSRGLTDVKLD